MPYLRGAFPIAPSVFAADMTLQDYAGIAGTARTGGAAAVLRLDSRTTIQRPWTVTGWTIQGRGGIAVSAGHRAGGQLGRLYASLIFGNPTPITPYAVFSLPPQEALPNLVKLWDGSTDEPFPVFTGASNAPMPDAGFFATTQQLPEPQTIGPTDQIAVGLWLTPSLLYDAVAAILLGSVSFSVTYDVDATPPPPRRRI